MDVRFYRIDLAGVDLSAQNLSGCSFQGCNLAGTKFDDAVIGRFSFFGIEKKDRLTLEQIKSTWNYKHGRMEGIRLPDDITKALKAEVLKKGKAPTKPADKPKKPAGKPTKTSTKPAKPEKTSTKPKE